MVDRTAAELELDEAIRTGRPAPDHLDRHESNGIVVPPVPEEPTPIRGGAPRASLEGWIVAILFAVAYGVVGYFMLTDARIISFDALHRINDAYMVWWNSPPKLAAINLDAAPLGAVAFLPFTLIKPFATSLVAVPVLTAIGAGLMMAMINSIMRRCEIPAAFRFIMLLLFGLNPMLVFYAGNGEPVVLGMVVAAISLLSVISWKQTGETRHLVAGGLAMGIAVMVDYGYALWAVGFAITILAISGGSAQERIRSSLILFLTPVVYALLVWILLNSVILKSPFGWITAQTGFIQVNTTGILQAVTSSPLDALGDLFQVVLGVAPLGLATVILLLLVGILKRDSLAFGLFALALLAIAVPLIRVLVTDEAQMMNLAVGLPLALLAIAGAAWVYYTEESWRIGVAVIMLIGLVAALPLGWDAMKNYEYQDQAQAFTRWVEDRDSQEGTDSRGGYTVGIDPEVTMARYINEQLPQDKNSILIDENFSYGPMILSGRPRLFLDRADEGEGVWEDAKADPFGKVDYMLITVSRAGDQLRKEFPQAVSGGEPGMTPIFRTERYVLVEVAPTKPPSADQQQGEGGESGGAQPQSTPRPVTPARPLTPGSDGPTESVPATPSPQSEPSTGSGAATSPSPSPGAGSGSSSAPQLEGE
ncbi:MAG TPA: hypothetical protein VMF31_01445 [Solirubrobacterales bacterium]|nr:hypothetical protein [Solirubrobacterales bacterium]